MRPLLISEAFELYRLEHIVYLNQSQKTEENHEYAKKSLIKFAGNIPITDLTFDTVRQWKKKMEQTCTPNTVRGYIIKLRVVLKHLHIKGYQNILNPEMVGVPQKENKVVDFISPDEVNRLIDAAFTHHLRGMPETMYRNRAIISLLYASGIRVSELCSLNISTLKMDDMTFTVIGKGNKPRLCFFDTRTKYFIESYLAQRTDTNSALFISMKTDKRVTPGIIQEMFVFVTEKAGFDKPITPHTMRHSFATNMLKNNANLLYVRDFLGHKSIQTTEMYTHVVNNDLREIYKNKHTT